MKAKNNKEIVRSYWFFSAWLTTCVVVGVVIFYCYTKTSSVEVAKIMDKTIEYDKVYAQQVDLANKIDSLYYFATLFNTKYNDALLQNSVSKRKQEIMHSMENMSGKDVRLCAKLLSEVNTVLSIKDSIRTLKIEEDMLRNDLQRCIEDNKAATRKITIGGIVVPK